MSQRGEQNLRYGARYIVIGRLCLPVIDGEPTVANFRGKARRTKPARLRGQIGRIMQQILEARESQ